MEHYDRCSILRLRIAWFATSPIIPIAGISVGQTDVYAR